MCAATVNSEHSLLAYTTQEEVDGEIIYDSFLTEIQPKSRVFTLNLRCPEFRKLQFIKPSSPSSRGTRLGKQQQSQSRLLVVVPDMFVALYTLKLQVTRMGCVLSEAPGQEAICKRIAWYQWDPIHQWLYYAQFENTSQSCGQNCFFLFCLNCAQSQPEILFNISLPLPYSEQYYLSEYTRFPSPLSLSLPVRELNLQVLYESRGLWCVCLQHARGVDVPHNGEEPSQQDMPTGGEKFDVPTAGKLDYTVYILHNSHMLYMQVPLPLPVSEPLNIHFMLINSFVVAYIPHFMLHFLNVGPNTDPCHHLAFGPNQVSEFPVPHDAQHLIGPDGTILSSAVTASPPGFYTTPVMECSTGILYEASVSTNAFLELFKATNSIEMMEDLLHLTVVTLRHHGVALSMIEHVCQSPMRFGDHQLFAEFLISFAFSNIVSNCRRTTIQQLPLTMTPTYQGKVFKNDKHITFAMLRFNKMHNTFKQLLVQSDQSLVAVSQEVLLNYEVTDAPFEVLCFIAKTKETFTSRVNLLRVMESTGGMGLEAEVSHSPHSQSPATRRSRKVPTSSQPSRDSSLNLSILKFPLSGRSNSGHNSLSSSVHTLKFLEPDPDQEMELKEMTATFRKSILSAISLERGSSRSQNVIHEDVKCYCAELEKHSHSLLQLIWESVGFNKSGTIHPLSKSLYRPSMAHEEILFELLEAYHLAHQLIGLPTPSGFHTLFASLGFVCLSSSLFLQYLRNKVFIPTRRFIELLLKDREHDKDHIVYEVICHTHQELANWALQQMHHPTVEALISSISADT